MFEKIFPKIHPEGYKFLAISGIITIIFGLIDVKFFWFVFVLITIWVYYFFRDPERIIILDDNYLINIQQME